MTVGCGAARRDSHRPKVQETAGPQSSVPVPAPPAACAKDSQPTATSGAAGSETPRAALHPISRFPQTMVIRCPPKKAGPAPPAQAPPTETSQSRASSPANRPACLDAPASAEPRRASPNNQRGSAAAPAEAPPRQAMHTARSIAVTRARARCQAKAASPQVRRRASCGAD